MRIICLLLPVVLWPALADAENKSDPAARLTAVIDLHFQNYWKENGVTPAPRASDAEFLRRASLHISGTIPPASRVRSFLKSRDPNKRAQQIEKLLKGPGYVASFAKIWSRAWVPEIESDIQIMYASMGFESWIREQLRKNTPYNEIARELIAMPFPSNNRQQGNYFQTMGQPGPQLFYIARGAKPGDLASAVARSFLGVRMGCAQCHDHPFDHWKQSHFWSFAAFFNGLERRGENIYNPIREILDRREIAIPDSDEVVQAKFLDGKSPTWKYKTSARETLADWVTSKSNPYFAKAASNRVWGHLFGRGLVDPIDDFSEANPASHPKLLDALAKEFAAADFDVKFLMRAITASQVYQLSSRHPSEATIDPDHFARFNVYAMSSDQLLNSLVQAGGQQPQEALRPGFFLQGNQDPRGEITSTFRDATESPVDRRSTILQSLLLMNGQLINQIADPKRDGTLSGVVEAPFLDRKEKIRTLFFATLGREPSKTELSRTEKFLAGNKDKQAGYSDLFWALLNSSEFRVIH